MHKALTPAPDGDWSVQAGDLEWTCWETGVHVADDLFSYASQVLAQPVDRYLPIEVTLDDAATPADLLASIMMCGDLLRDESCSRWLLKQADPAALCPR